MVERIAPLDHLTQEIVRFRDARDWAQFHNPKDLAVALSIEAAELLEHFLWRTPEQVEAAVCDPGIRVELGKELADVLIFGLLLAHRLGIDPAEAIRTKLQENDEKYPVTKAKGTAKKYTEL